MSGSEVAFYFALLSLLLQIPVFPSVCDMLSDPPIRRTCVVLSSYTPTVYVSGYPIPVQGKTVFTAIAIGEGKPFNFTLEDWNMKMAAGTEISGNELPSPGIEKPCYTDRRMAGYFFYYTRTTSFSIALGFGISSGICFLPVFVICVVKALRKFVPREELEEKTEILVVDKKGGAHTLRFEQADKDYVTILVLETCSAYRVEKGKHPVI